MKFAKSVRTAVALIGFGLCTSAMAENPIIQTYYSPDPAPVVLAIPSAFIPVTMKVVDFSR